MGAEKAANKDGSIPAWDGGQTKAPACFKGAGGRYCDPFAEDKPLFTISKANLDQYQAKLSVGQLELFKKYPDSYKMNVYKGRRSFANPQFVYDATAKNAGTCRTRRQRRGTGRGDHRHPVPDPRQWPEVIWNHKVRYRDQGVQRWNKTRPR